MEPTNPSQPPQSDAYAAWLAKELALCTMGNATPRSFVEWAVRILQDLPPASTPAVLDIIAAATQGVASQTMAEETTAWRRILAHMPWLARLLKRLSSHAFERGPEGGCRVCSSVV